MNYAEASAKAQTGDLLTTVSSIWVRMLTAESFSHSAIVLIEDRITYVVEVHESTGHTTKTLFEDWIKDYDLVYLGIPERCIQLNRNTIGENINKYLKKKPKKLKYGYFTLPLVWLNQIFPGKTFKHSRNVCSTLVGELWRSVGWSNEGKLADPGDLALSCVTLYRIEQ